MKLLHDRYTVHPALPFAIARSSTTVYERVRVRLTDDDGAEGWGEAAPNSYYGETADTVVAALGALARVVERSRTVGSLQDIDALEEWLRTAVPGDASARSAVSAAAHDLFGKRVRAPVWKLFGLEPQRAPLSSFTIAIPADDGELARRVREADSYPILKVKLGAGEERDEWIVNTVRAAAPTKTLRADANAAWSLRRARAMIPLLADRGFELIEQPLDPDDIEGLRQLRGLSPIPVIADESCRTASDIPRLNGAVDGINIKLSKCGGLAEARRMALEALRRGMSVMLGCMVETSLGISAMAQLAPLAHFADLDGAALLADDPFDGVRISDGVIHLSSEYGLGVTARRSPGTSR